MTAEGLERLPEPRRAGAGSWKPAFIAALRNSANVRLACETAGVSRVVAYDWRKKDPAFRAEWDEALDDACDMLEHAIRAQALGGNILALMFLLKAHRPKIYREVVRLDIEHRIREAAIREGLDPDEVVKDAKAILEGD